MKVFKMSWMRNITFICESSVCVKMKSNSEKILIRIEFWDKSMNSSLGSEWFWNLERASISPISIPGMWWISGLGIPKITDNQVVAICAVCAAIKVHLSCFAQDSAKVLSDLENSNGIRKFRENNQGEMKVNLKYV